MPKIKCAIFISDVGFGHMVRQRQIILELIKQFKNISITVFHSKNLKVLKKSFGNKIKYVKNFNNIFLYKKDLEGIKKIISDCENYTKEKIIELIQIQEKLNK